MFEGEKHDFWEFVYVDKGEAEIVADDREYAFTQGDIVFHKPNEFHSLRANNKNAPNLLVISFECKSSAMKFFENKMFNLGDIERNILADVVREGLKVFYPQVEIRLIKKPDVPFGSEQLLKIQLETLLIRLVRKREGFDSTVRLSSTVKERAEKALINRVAKFMSQNITDNLSLEEICCFAGISKTHLKQLFKEKTGMSAIQFFRMQRIECAKTLIREGDHNITEIAYKLQYSSVHSFSRSFKNITGMSPSEYARTVKVRI